MGAFSHRTFVRNESFTRSRRLMEVPRSLPCRINRKLLHRSDVVNWPIGEDCCRCQTSPVTEVLRPCKRRPEGRLVFPLYEQVQWTGLQQAGTSMVAEHVGIADIALQHLHRLVPRYVTHFEHAGAAAGCARQEAGAQAVGAIIGGVEPELAGVAFGEVAYALCREPRLAHLILRIRAGAIDIDAKKAAE